MSVQELIGRSFVAGGGNVGRVELAGTNRDSIGLNVFWQHPPTEEDAAEFDAWAESFYTSEEQTVHSEIVTGGRKAAAQAYADWTESRREEKP